MKNKQIKTPSPNQVDRYLKRWNEDEDMKKNKNQEEALDRVIKTFPENKEITDILIKAAALNDFYSTNIFSIYEVAEHIRSLDIDQRLKGGEVSLVADIAKVELNGKEFHFYSFATKYCSLHNPEDYPIYDRYVEKVLQHFKKKDKFAEFKLMDLRNYEIFKEVIRDFRKYYKLEKYSIKEIDMYLWQLGKEHFQ